MKWQRQTSAKITDDAAEAVPSPKRSRQRRWLIVGSLAMLAAALGVAGALTSGTAPPSLVREETPHAAPAFALPQLSEAEHALALAGFRGQPVVVNFWASWCVPCRTEMPALQAVYEQVHGQIAFVGIDHQDSRDDAVAFVRKTGVRYPIAFDPDGTTAKAYGLVGIPTTIFVDAQGREVARHLGEINREDLHTLLEQLFPNAMPRP